MAYTGQCVCGGVTFEISGDLGLVSACHCKTCRRITGHYFADAEVTKDQLTITQDPTLKWFQSSDKVRRGFCGTCGSVLFFDPLFHDWIAVAMGALDDPGEARLEKHIFTDSKGSYYDLADGVPTE
jgi:hypothetical protein